MNETITVRGFVGNDVRTITTESGLPIATFRLASTPRRYDREKSAWVDGETNWFSVTCFRAMAQNVGSTLSKGDPVLVSGRLKVRQWSNDAGQRGTSVEIDADGVGHDLTFGTGSFTRLSGGGTSNGGTESSEPRPGHLEAADAQSADGPELAPASAEAPGAWDASPADSPTPAASAAPF